MYDRACCGPGWKCVRGEPTRDGEAGAEKRSPRDGRVGRHDPYPASRERCWHRVAFTCNGESVVVGRASRLGARERPGIVSADGAPQGQCGCCTVLVDGDAVACVTSGRWRTSGRPSRPRFRGRGDHGRSITADLSGFCTPGSSCRCERSVVAHRVDLDGRCRIPLPPPYRPSTRPSARPAGLRWAGTARTPPAPKGIAGGSRSRWRGQVRRRPSATRRSSVPLPPGSGVIDGAPAWTGLLPSPCTSGRSPRRCRASTTAEPHGRWRTRPAQVACGSSPGGSSPPTSSPTSWCEPSLLHRSRTAASG
jgi:hypothetical protein